MRRRLGLLSLSAYSLLIAASSAMAANPIITTIYTADPSAHVWTDGKLWLYPSHDRDNAQWWDMEDWHVFSSSNLVNWTDHGVAMSLSDVAFGPSWFAWAPDCAYRNGKYYFYFPVSVDQSFGNTNRIGVAIGNNPQGPFVSQAAPLVSGYPRGFDPCVFIDTDNQAYLYCGQGPDSAFVAKLKPSMTELEGRLQPIKGLSDFWEGFWMYKRNTTYYAMYCSGHDRLHYATGSSPMGPFAQKGGLLAPVGCSTSHGSIVDFCGSTYLFYHTQDLSGDQFKRSVCIDKITFNADGTMREVQRTSAGVGPVSCAVSALKPAETSLEIIGKTSGACPRRKFDITGRTCVFYDKNGDRMNAGPGNGVYILTRRNVPALRVFIARN